MASSSSFGNEDVYAYEEEQEKQALLKGLHQPMKVWYNSSPVSTIKEKYGEFPQFWQDLMHWSHRKTLQKLYLLVSDRGITGSEEILEIEKNILDQEPDTTEDNIIASESKGSEPEKHGVPWEDVDSCLQSEEDKRPKRRSRWGSTPADGAVDTTVSAPVTETQEKADDGDDDAEKKRRKSRWSSSVPTPTPTPTPFLSMAAVTPIVPMLTPEIVQQTLVLQMQLKNCNDKLQTVVQDALVIEQDPNRSPSPPPRYDAMGKRSNTREVRMREALMNDRTRIIEDLLKLNPLFQPPADFVRAKPFRRLFIPLKEYPMYNFIGLIIGPRGNTQKRMERETGCKISIRGKGSVKEGSKGRANKNVDEDEDLHVYVTGDTEEQVDMASKMVQELLVPVEDDKNEHKQKQLKELALINGTLREEDFCNVCGEQGHRQFECPHRTKTFQAAGVKCTICGDKSHPTRDCPFKQEAPTSAVALDEEYHSFMAELGDGGGGGAKPDATGGGGGGGSEASGGKMQTTDATAATTTPFVLKPKQTIITVSQVLTGSTPTMSMSMPGPMGMAMAPGYPQYSPYGSQYGGMSMPMSMSMPGQTAAAAAYPSSQSGMPWGMPPVPPPPMGMHIPMPMMPPMPSGVGGMYPGMTMPIMPMPMPGMPGMMAPPPAMPWGAPSPIMSMDPYQQQQQQQQQFQYPTAPYQPAEPQQSQSHSAYDASAAEDTEMG